MLPYFNKCGKSAVSEGRQNKRFPLDILTHKNIKQPITVRCNVKVKVMWSAAPLTCMLLQLVLTQYCDKT